MRPPGPRAACLTAAPCWGPGTWERARGEDWTWPEAKAEGRGAQGRTETARTGQAARQAQQIPVGTSPRRGGGAGGGLCSSAWRAPIGRPLQKQQGSQTSFPDAGSYALLGLLSPNFPLPKCDLTWEQEGAPGPRELRKEGWEDPPLGLLEGRGPCPSRMWASASRAGSQLRSVCKAPACGTLWQWAQR